MNYTEVSFRINPLDPGGEILMAELSEIGFESFEETDTGLKAYIPAVNFTDNKLEEISILDNSEFEVEFEVIQIEGQNWNAVWESNYKPVLIKDMIYVMAPFHEQNKQAKYQILIEPKMSFGTAHHETTSLMLELMLEEEFRNKQVLDMGCGTGILAILAEMLGAINILAIDNDDNAFDNTVENVARNNCRQIDVELGGAEKITGSFDYILANINKNILLNDIESYSRHLKINGKILLSGFYKKDLSDIDTMANKFDLSFVKSYDKNDWIAALFIKSK
ncbi:MAG: 50S ribosomal protein L11 methyltransferase [Bacteroidales bacterium]|nr:50S ribosomal protein L11 methyltransferase [Bacteroidales bacterium]